VNPDRARGHQGRPGAVDTRRDMNVKTAACILLLLLLLAMAAPAETFLVAVTETIEGQPSARAQAAREGIFAALFDGDHIAFEFPPAEPLPSEAALCRLAVEAGANTVAVIVVDWHPEPLVGGAWRLRAQGSLVLTDARTGRSGPRVPIEVQNEGREAAADGKVLGAEIGAALIEAFRAWSSGS
jgi:hypothetical protein